MVDRFAAERHRMTEEQIRRRGLRDPRLVDAFEQVPRHLFIPLHSRDAAYEDGPLAIGYGQTISQPYIVALMTSLAELTGDERVLEVGTGSGYQAAILSRLAREVHSIERIPELAVQAARILRELRCDNVHLHQGDGSLGWPEAAPYEAIIVTAAAPAVPDPLVKQLAEGGRLVLPVEHHEGYQLLTLLTCQNGEIKEKPIAGVAFVPLRGQYGRDRK